MRALGFVQVECAGERVEHALGHAVEVSLFEAGVVADADPGEQRGFLSAQTGPQSAARWRSSTGRRCRVGRVGGRRRAAATRSC